MAVLRAVGRAAGLLGTDGAAAAEVDEWLEAVASAGVGVLPALEVALAGRTYLAGYGLTVADLAAYAVVAASGGPAGRHTARWHAMVRSIAPVEEAVKLVAPTVAAAAATATATAAAPAAAAKVTRSTSVGDTDTAPAAVAAAGGKKGSDRKSAPAPAPEFAAAAAVSAAAAPVAAAAAAAAAAPAAAAGKGGKEKGERGERGDKEKAGKKGKEEGGAAGGSGSEAVKYIAEGLPVLVGGEMGKVVTRFPPEPSGYLHIGHVKALLLNDTYAKVYKGRMIVRFDDTNPAKEKDEYEENIMNDIRALGVEFCRVTHTSDYFDLIETYARKLITEGKAFMDDTPREAMQEERLRKVNSARRDASVGDNTARFDEMLTGSAEGSRWCLRAKMDMTDANGTCRDPVLYRVNDMPHHRVGTRYKAYPTYDLACPIVDSVEGVTHALRSSEYHDRDKQYYQLQDMLGVRRVIIQDFARLNFIYTLLSKRKLTWFVNEKYVDGWDDPRFPTVQGILRRGCVVPALREFILSQGASKRQVEMEWDKFWAINKKHLDPVVPRYTALPADALVRVTLTNGPATPEVRAVPLHPKTADAGLKAVEFGSTLLLDRADVEAMTVGEEVTLMKWGNAFLRSVARDPEGRIVTATAELNPGGDFKKTKLKVTWLSATADNVPLTLSEFDYLIRVPNLLEGDDFDAAINPLTKVTSRLVGEAAMRLIKPGDLLQIERRGFCRTDRPFISEDRPASLFLIPDGRVRGLYNLADRVAAGATPVLPPRAAAAAAAPAAGAAAAPAAAAAAAAAAAPAPAPAPAGRRPVAAAASAAAATAAAAAASLTASVVADGAACPGR